MVALIAVSSAIYAIDKPYSYSVPSDLKLEAGMRVIVPFGRGNKRSEGIVLGVQDGKMDGLKAVEQVLDREPLLSESFIRMAAFLRERYFCTFYDAIKAMLPAGLWYDTSEKYVRSEKVANLAHLSVEEESLLRFAEDMVVSFSLRELKNFFGEEFPAQETLERLLKKKLLRTSLDFTRKIKDKTESYISLAVPVEQAMEYAKKKQRSAPVQAELLKLLCAVGGGSSKELFYLTGANTQTARRLEDMGYISTTIRECLRSSLPSYVEPAEPFTLNEEQLNAYNNLLAQSEQEHPGTALLYGVTGSGKTAVYISLIKQMLAKGKSALFLVPEIALTPQLISLLMSHFGDTVSVLHSALRVSERYDAWKKIKQGKSCVVVGTRSAVFAPVNNLGLIVVDEEQEHTYKSENSPRYHAREVALYRGVKENALVILGSATPSVETMYLANTGVYSLNLLNTRFNQKALPVVEIIDMKSEIRNGNISSLSSSLIEALRENISIGKQSILFLNRRGAGRYMICVECGDVLQCPRCSVSLTYHKVNNRLMCHHCGHSQSASAYCDICGGHTKIVGTGTQKIEQELQQAFPGIHCIRMDADTISATNSHEAILKRFAEEKIPILIGTQMVTKGLNFENVTLVGIVDADMSLYVNHYRAAETTFSMLTQVIGRSGRGAFEGKAIIQTLTPDHKVLQLAAQQNYDGFYELEIKLRMMQQVPPFGDIISVVFSGMIEDAVIAGAYDFRNNLAFFQKDHALRLLGPTPAAVVKVNNTYRYKLTICCKNSKQVRLILASHLKNFDKNKKYKGVTAYVDVNPYD